MTIIDRRYSVTEGTAVKAPCLAATTANIALSGEQTIDGVAVVEGDRVLVKDQSTGSENGIYSCSTGNWTRTRDFDGAFDIVNGTRVLVVLGAVNAETEFFVSTADPIVIDTTPITFTSVVSAYAAAAQASAAEAAAQAAIAAGFNWSTGDIKLTLKNVADAGWRLFDDGTIGDASSGATYANASAQALFTLMFDNFLDANCAIATSAGAGTTRSAQTNAATAWAAHCRIALPKTLGRALAVSGSGSGLTARALGVIAGNETATLVTANLPAYTPSGTVAITDPGHSHTVSGAVNDTLQPGGTNINKVGSSTTSGTSTTGITAAFTGTAQGGTSTAFSLMQPTAFLNAMVKL